MSNKSKELAEIDAFEHLLAETMAHAVRESIDEEILCRIYLESRPDARAYDLSHLSNQELRQRIDAVNRITLAAKFYKNIKVLVLNSKLDNTWYQLTFGDKDGI